MLRTRGAITAVSAAVVGGGLVAVTIGGPSLSAAEVPLSDVLATQDVGEATGGRPRAEHDGVVLDAAAAALGISGDDLRSRLEAGDTIAEIAGERSVDLATVTAAMVDTGEKAIDERAAAAKEALPDRVDRLVEGDWQDWGPRGPGGHGEHGPGLLGHSWLRTAADVIGIEPQALRDALRDGRSLADIADEKGVSRDTLVQGLLAPVTERIDQRVAAGDLDADRAQALKDRLGDWVERLVERPGPEPDDGAD